MFHVPQQYKVTRPPFNMFPSSGNNGFFELPITITVPVNDGFFDTTQKQEVWVCICASDGMGWEHVSVSIKDKKPRTPTWDEMCAVKEVFWDHEDAVIQLHPPRSQYVNMQPHTLHL